MKKEKKIEIIIKALQKKTNEKSLELEQTS